MLFGFWSWVLVALIVFVIFYANKMPEFKAQAEQKLKEGKVLLDKSRKELEAKAAVLTEKAKEKQKEVQKMAQEKRQKNKEIFDEEKEITTKDLAFMPIDEKTKEKKK